jgi:asparagine synthase (glutamine-hydrolysing)
VAAGVVPDEVVRRPKQPYRAPDALAFVGEGAPAWVDALLDPQAAAAAGVFDPRAVERLWKKCRAAAGGGQFSNSDNMALVGVLSTHLLHERLVRASPERGADFEVRTMVDRCTPHAAEQALGPGERRVV